IEGGTLATGLATNLYQFTGTAGQRIYFKGLLDSPSSSASAYLYSPDNGFVSQVNLEASMQWTLPSTGVYLLAVEGVQAGAAGAVSYQFELFDNVNPTAGLTLGQEVSGSLVTPGDQASYTFTGTAGQRIYFDGRSGTNGLFSALTDLYNSQVLSQSISG